MTNPIRYVARWMHKQYIDPDDQTTGNPDLDEYKKLVFSDRDEAGRHGCEKNCYGSECFVEVQEYKRDEDVLEHEQRSVYCWQAIEEWLYQDGIAIGRVESGW